MLVPALIAVLAFALAVVVSARWLPRLAGDRVGVVAFVLACGLIGAAAAMAGLDIYLTVRAVNVASSPNFGGPGDHAADILANGLLGTLRDAGLLLGLAAAVYLLGPAEEAA